MSHISKIELEIKDLDVLRRACHRLSLAFIQGKSSFKWFGQDGKCDHCIEIPGAKYEIGVLRKGSGFELCCDYYDPNLEKAVGKEGGLLKQAYAAEKVKAEARRKGYTVIEKKTQAGLRLHVRLN